MRCHRRPHDRRPDGRDRQGQSLTLVTSNVADVAGTGVTVGQPVRGLLTAAVVTSRGRATPAWTGAPRRGSSPCRGRGRTRSRPAGGRTACVPRRRSARRTARDPVVAPTPPGNSESPVNRCGVPAGSRYSRAIEPGVCPTRWITSRAQSPTATVSPSSTVGRRPAVRRRRRRGPPSGRRSRRRRPRAPDPVIHVPVGGDHCGQPGRRR